jgi:hypothetical protein
VILLTIPQSGTAAKSLISSTPGDYYGIFAVQIVTGCSTPLCYGASASTYAESCDPQSFVNLYPITALPLKGVTTDYYWLNTDLTEDPLEPTSTQFLLQPLLSLLGLPSDCGIYPNGAPYDLGPVGASLVFETQTITSTYQEETSITAAPGPTITSATPTPSSTSGGQYYLSTDSPVFSTMIRSLSLSYPPIKSASGLTASTIESSETTIKSVTTSQGRAPVLESQSIGISSEIDITVDGSIISPSAAGLYLVGSQTLAVGGSAITVAGTTISMASSGIVINGHPQSLAPTLNLPDKPPIVTIGSSLITANPAGLYFIGTQTLTPGGLAIIVSGTTISLATSGAAFVINGITQTIVVNPSATPTSPISTDLPLILGGTTLTANSAGAYVFDTQSLVPGGAAITVFGTTLSLAPSDAAIIVDGQTYTAALVSLLSKPSLAIATIGGQILSLNSVGGYEVGSRIVTPGGPAVTVDGTPVSLETVGTGVDLVIGGSTEAVMAVDTSSTGGLGGIIFSALGGQLPTPTQTQTATATATGTGTSIPLIHTGGVSACMEMNCWICSNFFILAVLYIGSLW